MTKDSGKVQEKAWQPPAVQAASQGFAVRPFPEIAKKEEGVQASQETTGTKEIKPGVAIGNINRAIASVSPPVPSPTVLPEGVQAKLTLGAPGDKYEQEADRVARQVVDEIHSTAFRANNTKSEGESQPLGGEAGRVQRQITVRAAGNVEGEISSEWERELQRAKSGGQPLSPVVREPMERAFGADFGGVRVYTGTQADRLARSIQAKAFTTGQDVFFRQGAYEPGSRGGQELIAHELTHIRQNGAGVPNNRRKKEDKTAKYDPGEKEKEENRKEGEKKERERGEGRKIKGNCPQKEVRRAIVVGTNEYSFQNVYDENGNPFLKEKKEGGERYKIEEKQDRINMTRVNDFYIKLNERSNAKIYKNLTYGRPMNIEFPGGNKVMYMPFKTYKHKADTKFELGSFHNEKERGWQYWEIENQLIERIKNIRTHNISWKEFDRAVELELEWYIDEMMPMLMVEEYRTPGALDVFKERWRWLESETEERRIKLSIEYEVMNNEEVPERNVVVKENVLYEIRDGYVGSLLPWAGEGGRERFKESQESMMLNEGEERKDGWDRKWENTTNKWYDISSPRNSNH